MAGDPLRIKKKHEDIEKMYTKLCSQQYNGKRKLTHEVMLEMIGDKFYLSPARIGVILSSKK